MSPQATLAWAIAKRHVGSDDLGEFLAQAVAEDDPVTAAYAVDILNDMGSSWLSRLSNSALQRVDMIDVATGSTIVELELGSLIKTITKQTGP